MKLNITSRLTLVLMLFAAGLVFSVTLLYYNFAQRALRESAAAELGTIAGEKLAQLNLVLHERSNLLSAISKSPEITENLKGLTEAAGDRSHLQAALTTRLESGNPFVKLSILGVDRGEVLASTSPADVGIFFGLQPFFVHGLKDVFVQLAYRNEPGAEPRAVISAPIHDRNGATTGVLVGWMLMNDLNESLSQHTQQHRSSETYLVSDSSSLFLTQPMLAAEPLELVTTDNSQASRECLKGMTGVTSGNDYRGVPALFAYIPAPDYGLCLITKIDLAEALNPIRRLTLVTVLIAGAAMLAAVLVAFVLARTFTQPILALQKGAEQFGRGNLEISIPVESSDELGMLAGTFNTMAVAIAEQKNQLEHHALELEREVEERTDALLKSESELRALFAAMQDVVAVMDSEGRYLSGPPTGNRRMYTFLNLVIGKRLHDVFPAGVADNALAKIHEALLKGTVIEFEHTLPIGRQERSFLTTISPLTETTVMWVAHDITHRIRTRNALARNEALNRAIIEHSPVGIAIRDEQARLLYGNQAWCRIRGLSMDQILESEKQFEGQTLVEYSIYRNNIASQVKEIYKKGGALFIPEVETGDSNHGAAQWVSLYCYGIVNDTGQVESVVTLTQDITERKERERELQALITLSSALRSAVTRAEMQPIILEQLQRLLNVDAVGLVLRDPANHDLLVGTGTGEWSNWEDSTGQPADTGIAGGILLTAQPYLNQDIRSDSHFWGNYVGRVKALAAVPLIAREQTIGLLAVGSLSDIPGTFLRIVSAFGEIAANALYRSILYDQTERRLQWLTAIRSIDQAITNSLDLHTTLNVVLEKAVNHLQVDAADILLLQEGNRLVYAAGRGFKSAAASKANLLVGQLQAGKAAFERKTVLISDFECTTGWNCELMKQEGFRGYCAVPLIAKGQLKGVIEVFQHRPFNVDREWLEFLESLAGQAAISLDNAEMLVTVQKTNMEMTIAYDVTLEGWSNIVDIRSKKSPGHTERIANMTQQLAKEMGVDNRQLIHIRRGALLHDVGTMMIPEKILLKTRPLTPRELKALQQHPVHSHDMLSPIRFLRPALEIPYGHHENWDGTGYPRGLQGDAIPLSARIFAVAEAWEDLIHDHSLHQAWTPEKALSFIMEQAGRRFDPQVVTAFRRMIEKP
jgi:PAS domain S-box-containing protein